MRRSRQALPRLLSSALIPAAYALVTLLALGAPLAARAADLLSIDHYIPVRSTAPAIVGQDALLYVRELTLPGTVLRGGPAADRVVLFVHGAGTPAEVSFDVPYRTTAGWPTSRVPASMCSRST